MIKVHGYVLERNDQGSRHGGGVAMYIKESLCYELHSESEFRNSQIESLWIKVERNHYDLFFYKIILGAVVIK